MNYYFIYKVLVPDAKPGPVDPYNEGVLREKGFFDLYKNPSPRDEGLRGLFARAARHDIYSEKFSKTDPVHHTQWDERLLAKKRTDGDWDVIREMSPAAKDAKYHFEVYYHIEDEKVSREKALETVDHFNRTRGGFREKETFRETFGEGSYLSDKRTYPKPHSPTAQCWGRKLD